MPKKRVMKSEAKASKTMVVALKEQNQMPYQAHITVKKEKADVCLRKRGRIAKTAETMTIKKENSRVTRSEAR